MTDAGAKEYVVFQDWVELYRFSKLDGALLFQRFIKGIYPKSTVRTFHESGTWLRLVSDSDYPDQVTITSMKGGDDNMINGRDSRQPAKKFTAGAVSAALWSNKTTLKDGRTIDTLSVSLDRRYKDSDGEWKSSSSFKDNDIPKAMLVLAKAYEFMTSRDDDDSDGPGA